MRVAHGKGGGFCLVGEYGSGSHSARGMGEAVFFHGVSISVHLSQDSVSLNNFVFVNCAKGLLILFIFSRKQLFDLLILSIVFFVFPSLISATIFTSFCLPGLGLFCFSTFLCHIIKSLCVFSLSLSGS